MVNEDLDNAREGVLYLFSKANCDNSAIIALSSVLGLGAPSHTFHGEQVALAANPSSGALFPHTAPGTMTVGGTTVSMSKIEKQVVKLLLEGLRFGLAFIEKWRKTPSNDVSFLDRIVEYARSGLRGDVMSFLLNIAKVVAKSMIPLFKSTYEFYEALTKSLSAMRSRYQVYLAGKGVPVRSGLPQLAVGGVIAGLDTGACMAMFKALVTGVLWIMDIASLTAGAVVSVAQSIVNIVSSAAHDIARLAITLYEVHFARIFIEDAKANFENVASPWSMHRRPDTFDPWYRNAVSRVPAIAAATIRSGICGDKMRWLHMIDSKDSPMTQSQYDRAFKYLEAISRQAGNILTQGVRIRSTDPMIHKLLNGSRQTFNEAGDPGLTGRLADRMSMRAAPASKPPKPEGFLSAAANGRAIVPIARKWREFHGQN